MQLGRRTMLAGAAALVSRAACAEDRVFLAYTQSELDRAYDQGAWASNAAALQAGYASESAAVRRRLKVRTERYGPSEPETLDIFQPTTPSRAPIHVFIHGGVWRLLSKDDASAPAPTFLDHGGVYIALNFANAEAVRLPEMAEQCRRALRWIAANAASFGGDPGRIHISGHSSGAHLAAVMLTTDWTTTGQPAELLKSGLLMSGIYDLRPVALSSHQKYLQLSPEQEAIFSPMRHLDRVRAPVTVAWGDLESPEFKRQGTVFADALAGMGQLVARRVLFNTNHFQMPLQLNRPDTVLGHMALVGTGLI